MFKMATYLVGRSWIVSYVQLSMSGGTQVGQMVTHRGKKLEENHKKLTNKYYQEIYGSIFNNLVKKALHTVSTHKTPMSR